MLLRDTDLACVRCTITYQLFSGELQLLPVGGGECFVSTEPAQVLLRGLSDHIVV